MKTPIQSLLFRAGISQAKVAAQLGIDAKTASQKLTGQKDFWWREVVALCELLFFPGWRLRERTTGGGFAGLAGTTITQNL